MKNKSMAGLQPLNLLLILGMSVALLISTSSSQMISASVEGSSPGPNTSNSNQGQVDAGQCTVYHPCSPVNSGQSQGSSQGTAPDSSSGASSNPNQQAIDHINQAQSALQNGDIAGAQMHMDAAKKALLCEGCEP